MKFPIALLVTAMFAAPAVAQIDYRNLDHGRPGAVEDAYPLERYGFEASAGYRRFGTAAGAWNLLVPELAWGFARGAHAAVRLPFAFPSGASAGDGGLAGADVSLLLNLSTERTSLPGLAVRVDGSLPAGAAAGRGAGLDVAALATRSFGTHRAHLNAGFALVTPDAPGAAAHPSRWWLGLAVDRTLLRQSTLLVGEGAVGSEHRGDPLRFSLGLGIRRQLTPTLVADLGLGWDFRRGARAEPALTFGLSRAFALAFLMPVRSR